MIQLLAAFILVAAGQAEDSCADGSCASSRQLLQRNSESSDTVVLGDEEWGGWGGSSAGSCTTAGSAGVGAGHPCIFPFTYKRNNYSACTTVDHSTPWCSTQVDGKQEFVLAKWGECSSSCLGTTTTTTIITSTRAPLHIGETQIYVASAAGIKVGDQITLNGASLLQAKVEKWGTSSQNAATYVIQNVTVRMPPIGILELDRKLEQNYPVGTKVVVSPPPPTTTTTTALVPDTTTTTTTPAPTTTTSTTTTTPAPTTTTSTTTTTPAPTTTTSTTTTTPAPTTTTSTTTTTPAPTTTTSTTTTTPAPTTTTSTTTTTPAPTTVPTTTEVTTRVMSTTTDATTVTTTKRWRIIPVVVNATKTPKFKLKLTLKK